MALLGLIAMQIATWTPGTYLPMKYSVWLLIVAGVAFAVSGGTLIGELIARLRDARSEWKGYHLTVLSLIYLFALAQAPSVFGLSVAKLDMSMEESPLPYVSKEGSTEEPWRLVIPFPIH